MSQPYYNDEPKAIWTAVWHQKTLVFSIAFLAVAGGCAYTFLATPIWQAKATIVFPVRQQSTLGPAGAMDQVSLAASLGGGPTPLKIYTGFLESERTLKSVADTLGLKKRDIKEMRRLTDQAMENSLTISATSKNPDLAKEVVDLHLKALAEINREINDPLMTDDLKVLSDKMKDQQKSVAEIEKKMLSFQNGAVTAPSVSVTGSGKEAAVVSNPSRWQDLQRQLEIDLGRVSSSIATANRSIMRSANSTQLPSNIPPVRKWRERLVDLEYQLKLKELEYAPESPEVRQLKEAVETTRNEMEKEVSAYAKSVRSGVIDPTSPEASLPAMITQKAGLEAQLAAVRRLAQQAPSESIELARLTRDLQTQSMILQQLQAQYKLAEVQAAREPNRWQILDDAEVEDRPVNKSYTKNGILSLMLGLFFGVISGLVRDSVQSKKQQKPVLQPAEIKEAA